MEAKESKIQDILTENKKYIIPPYQRPYSWTEDHALCFLDDIYESYEAKEKEYFIGSMICINKGDNTYEIVDGQQRLTTSSLIVCALKNLITDTGVRDDLQKRILPIDPYSDQRDEPRLKIRSKEENVYKYFILQGMKEYNPEKTMPTEFLFVNNYNEIFNYLSNKNDLIYKEFAKYLVQNVYIVFVQTDSFASSFRLFNVLNNRGMALNNSDLLKNTLFEAADSCVSEKNAINAVESIWSDIEDIVGVDSMDKFLTIHKISEKQDRDRALQKLLDSYTDSLKKDFENNPITMSSLLYNSAKNYEKIKIMILIHL